MQTLPNHRFSRTPYVLLAIGAVLFLFGSWWGLVHRAARDVHGRRAADHVRARPDRVELDAGGDLRVRQRRDRSCSRTTTNGTRASKRDWK